VVLAPTQENIMRRPSHPSSLLRFAFLPAALFSVFLAGQAQADAPGPGPRPDAPRMEAHHGEHGFGQMSEFFQRQREQMQHIARGMRNGNLTQEEGHRLQKQQRQIHAAAREFMGDGHMGRFEMAMLDRRLDRAERSIERQMQDEDRAWFGSSRDR